MTDTIKLTLSVSEVNRLLALLGDQPIKSGLNDLTTKIKTQGDEQISNQSATPVEVDVI